MRQAAAHSSAYERKVIFAIFSIIFFVFIYIFLIVSGFLLVVLSYHIMVALLSFHIGYITLLIGLGLIAMSVMVTIFLFKFIFSKHNTDRSHLIEVTKEQQPRLFGFIEEVVRDVKTDFPKRVYLSADVNAAVFYDSSFWSMFLPVKKNLIIGIGLVNAVSVEEFKAILAHEFGHFSQRSMKVGVYVSNVNQVIFNMLNDNESYNKFVFQWGNVNAYFSFFVMIAVKIIEQIQYVLKKLYEIVNLNYLQLSREMEFDADSIAAQVAGSSALSRSLMRISLADFCYNSTINYYFTKVDQKISTENIYPQQKFVMDFTATQQGLPIENGFPQVSAEYMNKFSKSKLSLVEDWNSHPSIEDRVDRLERLNVPVTYNDTNPAITIFEDISGLERMFTKKLFLLPAYTSRPVDISMDAFVDGYTKEYASNSFGTSFNGYYDYRNPAMVDMQNLPAVADFSKERITTLFDHKAVDMAYRMNLLESDITALKQISNQEIKIKWFQFDGNKYYYKKADVLVEQLEAEAKELKKTITAHDTNIYAFFHELAVQQGKEEELNRLYNLFQDAVKIFEHKDNVYVALAKETGFLYEVHQPRVIQGYMTTIYRLEKPFKKEIEEMLENPLFDKILNQEIRDVFSQYLSQDWMYFNADEYNQKGVDVFVGSLQSYQYVLSQLIFEHKKALLDYKVALLA